MLKISPSLRLWRPTLLYNVTGNQRKLDFRALRFLKTLLKGIMIRAINLDDAAVTFMISY